MKSYASFVEEFLQPATKIATKRIRRGYFHECLNASPTPWLEFLGFDVRYPKSTDLTTFIDFLKQKFFNQYFSIFAFSLCSSHINPKIINVHLIGWHLMQIANLTVHIGIILPVPVIIMRINNKKNSHLCAVGKHFSPEVH